MSTVGRYVVLVFFGNNFCSIIVYFYFPESCFNIGVVGRRSDAANYLWIVCGIDFCSFCRYILIYAKLAAVFIRVH